MATILCVCLAVLHINVAYSQFAGPQQPSTDAAFSMGTDTAGTQTDVFSSTPTNSSVTQTGFSTPVQSNDFSQTGISSPPQSNNPFSQTGISPQPQPNGSFSPNQPGNLTQTGFPSPNQSNGPFSQSGFTSPSQTNDPTFQNNNLSGSTPRDSLTQNNTFSSSQSNISNIQPGQFSPTPPNDPLTQNNIFSSSSSNPFAPTQSNSTIVLNSSATPNQLSFPSTQNGDVLSGQSGIPNTQTNGFLPTNTNSSTVSTNFLSPLSNNNSTVTQTDSPPNQASAAPTSMQLILATMLAGQYSNVDQYQDDNARNVTGPLKHAHIEVTYVPVYVASLSPAVVLYYEQRVDNSDPPARQAMYAFSQESACLLRMSTFDIANASRFSVSPEGLRALETLTPAELSNRPECDAFWEQVDDEFFTSYLSTDQCTFEVSPRVVVRPSGSRNLTCSGMTFTEVWRRVVGNQVVGGSPVPYVFKKTGNAFPVPVNVFSSNACFKVPCMNSGVASPAGPTWADIKQHMTFATNSGSSQSSNAL